MGRIAELFEKKALGTITEAEVKELEQLQKEASLLSTNKDEETPPASTPSTPAEGDDATPEEEVDKLAQRFADSVSSKMSGVTDKLEAVLKGIESHKETPVETRDASDGYIFDRMLGRKAAISELAEQKLKLHERKVAGKSVTEISMKTFHFLHALSTKNVEKLQLLSEGVAADGGFLVPEEFANMIIEDIRDQNIMRQIAAPPITINSDTFHLPSLASRPKAQWRNEKAVKATSTVQFGENVFTPYSLAAIVGMSNEVNADATLGTRGSLVNYVANLMSTSLNEREEEAFWRGSGSGQPSGVDGGVYSLRTVTAGLTDGNRADAVIAAFFRTPQGYRNRGAWVGNSATWEKVATLKDSQGNYLLSRLSDSPTQTLKGRPTYESNYLAGGTLLYGDWSYYQIVDREGISVRISDEATVAGQSAFERNLVFVRTEKRVDAELVLPNAVTKVVGLGNA